MREQILGAARELVRARSTIAHVAVPAWVILCSFDQAWVSEQASHVLLRWVPGILSYSPGEETEAYGALLNSVYHLLPTQLLTSLKRMLLEQSARGWVELRALQFMSPSNEIVTVLREALDLSKPVTVWLPIFEALMRMDPAAGIECARGLLNALSRFPRTLLGCRFRRTPSPRPSQASRTILSTSRREKLRVSRSPSRPLQAEKEICAALLRAGGPIGWGLVHRWCRQNRRRASSIWSEMPRVALPWGISATGEKLGGASLSPQLLSDCYAWLRPRVAEDEEGRFNDRAHFLGQVLKALESQGTNEAVMALEALQARFPGVAFLRSRIAAAKRRSRALSWQPMALRDVIALGADEDSVVVSTEEQLIGAVLAALDDYRAELQGETRSVSDLWCYDGDKQRVYWPKDENDFSDHLKRFLLRRLRHTVVHREVEIRPAEGARKGEHTDLLIQTIVPMSGRRLSCVVEVKGCWNKRLIPDLKDQLVNRYLKQYEPRFGIYVVGWFGSACWRQNDGRRAVANRFDPDRTRQLLEQQATESSTGGRQVRVVVIDARLDEEDGAGAKGRLLEVEAELAGATAGGLVLCR